MLSAVAETTVKQPGPLLGPRTASVLIQFIRHETKDTLSFVPLDWDWCLIPDSRRLFHRAAYPGGFGDRCLVLLSSGVAFLASEKSKDGASKEAAGSINQHLAHHLPAQPRSSCS